MLSKLNKLKKLDKQDLQRAVRHGERELRAAGGDMLTQLDPRNIYRDARDLAIKFAKEDVLQAYLGPRMWGVVVVVLAFVLVSTVVSIDVMFRFARFFSEPAVLKILALPFAAVVWAGGVLGQAYVFAIWVEGRAAQKDRAERGIHVKMPSGFLAYLKYSRALVPWIAVALCVALPLLIMAGRAPLVALGLFVVAAGTPLLYRKIDS
jgi:Ca2+/Na+ antiporter